MSTFHGLEMAKQALFAQQSALYTTGHNISNANTPGYTRQRVNFETLPAFPTGSRNRPQIPGQLGTGVEAGSIQRIRNEYLDFQFRAENSKTGYWTTKANALARMEGLLNEPSDSGLSKIMDQFWQSLQDLSVNPENSGARSVVARRGQALATTFNYFSDSLNSIRADLKSQIDVTVKDVNSLIHQIDAINKQIKNVEPHGYLPNDLYDERDRLIDELSSVVNIKVTYDKSSDSSLDIAAGLASIEVVNNEGNSLNPPVTLIDGKKGTYQEFSVEYSDGPYQAVEEIKIGDESYEVSEFSSNGSLKGFIESYGYTTTDGVVGEYTDMLADLDLMAKEFAKAFNEQHSNGYDLVDDGVHNPVNDFFVGDSAGTISVNQDILDNPDLIAASADGTSGNGDNASLLADVFDKEIEFGEENTSVKTFYESIIGDLGVRAQEANRMADNTGILKAQVQEQRMSVSSVSLDEEMSNMIKFQHAYNAAARSLTAVDEMLDRIINNLGLVGR